jgi:uncharacterized protein (TIGR02246 family)
MQEIENSTRRVLDDLMAAWNHRDVDGFLRLFAEDALYVTGTGSHWEGRAAIRRGVASRISGPSGPQQVAISEVAVKALGAHAAVALVRWRMDATGRAGLFTLVTTATSAGWRIVLLHNTDSAA